MNSSYQQAQQLPKYPKKTIYISSTFIDLVEHREKVRDALRLTGYDVICMEEYVAKDIRPVDKCLDDVARADIYVGIFAFRYGYIPPPDHRNSEQISITELELREAERLGKPCLLFLADAAPNLPNISTMDEERATQLRAELKSNRLVSFFSSPNDLAIKVQAAVVKLTQIIDIRPRLEIFLASNESSEFQTLTSETLPIYVGNLIRLIVHFDIPAYPALVWLTPNQEVHPLFPWEPDWRLNKRGSEPLSILEIPHLRDHGLKVKSPSGTETIILLARGEPFITDLRLANKIRTVDIPETLRDENRLYRSFFYDPQTPHHRALDLTPQPLRSVDHRIYAMHQELADRLSYDFPNIEIVSFTSKVR